METDARVVNPWHGIAFLIILQSVYMIFVVSSVRLIKVPIVP